jgi:hypothetical protein
MARKTEITLARIGFAVRKETPADDRPAGEADLRRLRPSEDGRPVGARPDRAAPGCVEIIHVPFDEAAKDTLLAQFTGGVVLASEMPNGKLAI